MGTKIDRTWKSKLRQQIIKMEVQGLVFEDFYGFWQACYFDVFRSAKRRAKIKNKSTFGRQDGPIMLTFIFRWASIQAGSN